MAPAPKTRRARKPPKAKGIKKPITKESHMKLLKKQVQQHNQRACIRVPKNASIKDIEDILSRRPVISKRPAKLTSAERAARRAARDAREIKEAFRVRMQEAQNKKNQAERMQNVIDKYSSESEAAEKKVVGLASKAGMGSTKENPFVLVPKRKKKA